MLLNLGAHQPPVPVQGVCGVNAPGAPTQQHQSSAVPMELTHEPRLCLPVKWDKLSWKRRR